MLATLASDVTGVAGFLVLEEVATALAGGAFLALVGGLLIVTGSLLWVGERADDRNGPSESGSGPRDGPDAPGLLAAPEHPRPRCDPRRSPPGTGRSPRHLPVLMALYSGVSPFEIAGFVGIEVDEVEEIYERLREIGAVDKVRERIEGTLNAQGRNMASEAMNER